MLKKIVFFNNSFSHSFVGMCNVCEYKLKYVEFNTRTVTSNVHDTLATPKHHLPGTYTFFFSIDGIRISPDKTVYHGFNQMYSYFFKLFDQSR